MSKRVGILLGVAAIAAAIAIFAWSHRGGETHAAAQQGTGSGIALPQIAGRTSGDLPVVGPLADDDPVGTLRLEGLVLGPDDQPVGGAIVALGSTPPRTATTEADGSFAFDRLVARTYRITARAPAGVAGPVVAHLTDKSEPVVLHLRAGAKLAVEVVGSDGKPIDADVELRGDDPQRAHAPGGHATFAPVVAGPYMVVASAPGMAPAHQLVRVAGDSKARVVLAPGAPVSGKVVDDHGAPVAGARVVWLASGRFVGQADWRLDAVTTNSDGAWTIAALPAGSFRFVATHPEHASGTSSLVVLDGAHETTGVVVPLPPGAVVHGKVVDSTQQPVDGARVDIAPARGPNRRQGMRDAPRIAYSDAHGEFTIRGLPRAPLTATAFHDRGASSGVDVDTTSGEAKDITITLDLTASIAGTVVDAAGQPIEGAQVIAFATQRAGFNFARVTNDIALTDAGGRFRIGGLAEGEYSLRANRAGVARNFGGRGRRGSDGVTAKTGDEKVQIVLPAEGGVKGKLAFADGHAPTAFTASVGATEQAFVTGDFELDAIAPGDYQLELRGPGFQAHAQDVTIEPGKVTDVGAITVAAGRVLAGIVTSHGQPVPGATVYAGHIVMGGGASNEGPLGGFNIQLGAGTKQDTTDAQGSFSLAGFGGGDLTIIADLPSIGRSKALRVTEDAQDQSSLVLELVPYGALSGVLRQGGQPAPNIVVTAQSTTTPGAVYMVQAGADGAYRFDRLAPDTYKVSATLGNPRRGMRQYSQQADVPAGSEVKLDLTADPGSITLDLAMVATKGQLGVTFSYLATGAIAAATATQLSLALAAQGPGAMQAVIGRGSAAFTEVVPGAYTACVVPLPSELRGGGALAYVQEHGNQLRAFCQQTTVAPSPPTQTLQISVEVPQMIGSGSGSGK